MVENYEASAATAGDSAVSSQTLVQEAYKDDSSNKPLVSAETKAADNAKVDQTFGKVEIVDDKASHPAIVEQETTTSKPVDKEACGKSADAIYDACHVYGNDNDAIYGALQGKSKAEIAEMNAQFAEKHNGQSIADYLKDEMKRHPEELNKALGMLGEKPVGQTQAKDSAPAPADAPPAAKPTDAPADGAKPADSKSGDAKPGDSKPGDAPGAKPADAPADSEKVKKGAEGIHEAMNGMWRSDSDYEKVNKILQGMTDKERDALKDEYKTKYGVDLNSEFKDHAKDAQQDKALNLLNKKDGDGDDAGRIHTALVERHQLVEGRSNANCEKDIRDTLSTMNSEQIAQLDKTYQARYGTSLREALMNDDKISQKSKDSIDIYLKGSDKRTDADTLKLADAAVKNKDIEMFGEAMRNASPEARKQFQDNGGEQKLKDAFEGHWYNAFKYVGAPSADGNVTDKELRRAEDLAKDGHMSTANKIRENTGVVSNTDKAIEQAIKDMSPEERAAYTRGKELSKGEQSNLSDADKKALATYNDIHKALIDSAPVDTYKIAKWEDMVEHKDGSVAGRIEAHKGHLYNDSASDTTKDIENMSKADWEHAKAHPEDRDAVLKSLNDLKGSTISQADIDQAMKLYDQKMSAKTFEESQGVGHRALVDKLDGDTHWYKNDRKSMVEDITHMTPEEQAKYKNDPEYRQKLDALLKDKLGEGPALDAAKHLLEKVARGEKPEADLVVKMDMRAQEEKESKTMKTVGVVAASSLIPGVGTLVGVGAMADSAANDSKATTATSDAMFGSHSASAVRDMQDEFQKHPELRERLLHPKTEEDKKFAADFEKAGRQAMGDADYDKYAKTLIETGHISVDDQMQLNKGLITNDKTGSYKDVLNATPEEKNKILHDKDYQEKVLGYLSDDDRKVALAVLEQGKEQPEDTIRGKLNHWGGSDDIMQTLRGMKPAEVEKMKEEYARKYGHDLTADLIDKLGGSDKLEAENILKRQPTSAREAFNDARDQYYQSYDGAGKAFVNGAWDGTGHMSEDALNDFAAKMDQFSAKFKELPPDQQKELSEKLNKSIDLMIESKGAAAGAVVDTVIAVAAVGGAVFTDGVSLGLLAATGAGGAALKIMVNSVLMGSDYDWRAKGVGKDAAIGFVDGFVSMLGPGEVGSLLKVGEAAGKAATEQVLKEGAEQLIKKGGEAVLEKEMQSAVKNAIVHGTYEVSDKALTKMVEQVAKEGATDAEKAALKQSLKTALEENLSKETKSVLQRVATEYAFNMAGGALGGASANTVGAALEWDNSKSVGENMANIGKAAAMGAAFGAVGAAGFTTVFKVGGSMYHGLAESFHLKPGEKLNPEQLQKLAQETGMEDAKFHYDEQGNLVMEGHPDRPAILPPEPKPVSDINGNPHGDPVPGPHEAPKDKPHDLPKDTPKDNPQQHLDPHGDTIPPTERPATPERINNDQLLNETPEVNRLPEADKAAALERAGKDPLFKADVIDNFNGSVEKLTSSPEWNGLTPEEKTAQLQKLMDKFADDHGLAHSKLELSKSGDGVGGSYGDGKIEINPATLDDPATLTERLYHENVHAQQDKLVISNMADELKIGKNATPEQISAIKAEYLKRTNGELSDQHLQDILGRRDGKALGADDVVRAKNAEASFKNDPARSGQLEKVDAQFQAVNKEMQPFMKSDAGDASQVLLQKMANDPEYAKLIFGGEPPKDVQHLIDIQKRINNGEHIAFPKEEADKVLRSELSTKNSEVGAERNKLINDYLNNGNENEAYLIGRKAKLQSEHGPAQHSDTAPGHPQPSNTGRTTDPIFRPAGDQPRDTQPLLNKPEHIEDGPVTERAPFDAPPNTQRIPQEISPEIQHILDGADVPAEQRAALLERIRSNELAKPEVMNDFLKDGGEMGSRWQDLSKVVADARANEPVLKDAQGRFYHEVHDQLVEDLVKSGMRQDEAIMLANHPSKLREMVKTDSPVAKFFNEHPDKLSVLNELNRAQDIHNSYTKAVTERTADLQKMIDKFNQEHNLPHTEIRLVDGREMAGANGTYQDGVIRLNADQIMAKQDMTALLETLYHENVHSQQDSLIVRKVADRFENMMGPNYKLHEPPTKAELIAIQSLYKSEGIGPISEDHLKDVLGLRKGAKLTPEQTAIAESLARDWKSEGLGNYNQYSENVRTAYGKLDQLNGPEGTKNMMKELANDPDGKLAYALFGDHPAVDVKKFMAEYQAGRINDALAHDILESSIQHNIDQMNVVKAALRRQYLAGVHETEAFVLGETLKAEARKGAAAEQAPETTGRTTQPMGSFAGQR